jgi:hypothetical protein
MKPLKKWFNPSREEDWTIYKMPMLGFVLFAGEELIATGAKCIIDLQKEKARVEAKEAISRVKYLDTHLAFEKWLKEQ